MKRIWINICLGLLAPFIAFLGAAPFEVPGKNPMMERVGAGLAAALYCAACQFWLTRRYSNVAYSSWLSVAAMVLAIGVICLLSMVAEGFGSWPLFAVPVFVAGFIGAVAGMVLGRGTDRSGDA
jgi:hypothetical protein